VIDFPTHPSKLLSWFFSSLIEEYA